MSTQGFPLFVARVPLALLFMKNLAVIGGLLLVFAFGAGALSLDTRRAGSK